MHASLRSCSLWGIDAFAVDVEVNLASGSLPSYQVVGLPTTSVREGSARIQAALKSLGLSLPCKKITVNLAPGDRRKDGASFDLPIALALLVAQKLVDPKVFSKTLILGELGLDGTIRSVRGSLAAALLARELGCHQMIVPLDNAAEAAEVKEIKVFGLSHLSEALQFGRGEQNPHSTASAEAFTQKFDCDMSDVKGQPIARAALEVAVAGGHNIILIGPPGIGKTMLAKRVPTILPDLTRDESLETTRIHSAAGLSPGGLLRQRPFRAPHHTISRPGLVGGGSPPHPGELSLAHHGVLFLDELPEFSRGTLECLRQPLEERRVSIVRSTGTIEVPASVLLVASANPCPCGWHGSFGRECVCSEQLLQRYRARLSGPLMDRIDLQIFVPNVTLTELRSQDSEPNSHDIRQRILNARAAQHQRLKPYGLRINAEMDARALRETCHLSSNAEDVLQKIYKKHPAMTGRGVHRLIKIARTLADLGGSETIEAKSLLQACGYRYLDSDPLTDARSRCEVPSSARSVS